MPLWFRFFSRWPLWALHALGQIGGWLAWLLSPIYRRRFLDNAREAGLGASSVWPAIGQAGAMSMELPRLWAGAPVPVHWARDQAAVHAYASGQGVLFLTPHLGCFEVTAQALAERFGAAHGPLTVLYRPARQAWLAQLMATARNRPALSAVPTTLAGVRQMIKALRAGQAVGLLPDQVPPDGQGVWVPYFGRTAYTMTLAARLAQQTGCAVVLTWCERLPGAQGFAIRYRALPQPLPDSGEEASAALVNQAMEWVIGHCPDQYLWGYNRYKQPRRVEASAGEAKA